MTLQRFFQTTAICAAFFGATTTVWGQSLLTQAPSYPSISASGSSNVKCLPETVQGVIALQVKGKTAEEAIEKMKAEQKTALEKLQKIGIEQEHVRFEDFGIDQFQESRQRQMEIMVMQRIRPNAAPPKPLLAAESIALKCMLIVELPLTGKTPVDILKESLSLKQKIKTADFAPKKEAMTPEEEEQEEEMAGMMHHYSDEPVSEGEPQLIYIANLSDESLQKAYTEAFAQARKQGEMLATATNAKLGTLMEFSGDVNRNRSMSYAYSSNQDHYMMQLMRSQEFGDDKPMQGISMSPDSIEFSITVHAVFVMER